MLIKQTQRTRHIKSPKNTHLSIIYNSCITRKNLI